MVDLLSPLPGTVQKGYSGGESSHRFQFRRIQKRRYTLGWHDGSIDLQEKESDLQQGPIDL